ncbi:MAG: pseudouridine synthase [Desulfobaccales bacterium]
MTLERLQKFLSRAGVASRRQAEELIREGKVKVNGRVVIELGVKIDPNRDRVQVEGKRIGLPPPPVTLMLHKPHGCVSTTRDPQGRRTVLDLAPREYGRLYPVGRLDYDATGLMLLTNDGELAQRLTHPRYQVPRTYRVTVAGEVEDKALARLAGGIDLDGRPVSTEVKLLKKGSGKTILEITVWEGRYHLIKRLLADIGHPVLKLKRIAFGPLRLGRLARGAWRPLTRQEQVNLQVTVGHKYLKPRPPGKAFGPEAGPKTESPRLPETPPAARRRRRVFSLAALRKEDKVDKELPDVPSK